MEGGAKYIHALPDVAFAKRMLTSKLIETQ